MMGQVNSLGVLLDAHDDRIRLMRVGVGDKS